MTNRCGTVGRVGARIGTMGIALAVGALVLGATPARAAEMDWDQAAVAGLAGELAAALKGIRKAVRQAGSPSVASMQARAWHEFSDKLRLIEQESKHLASALGNGAGQAETLPAYRRLQMLVRDARDLGPKLFIQKPLQDQLDAGSAVLGKLAMYYPADA